MIVIVAAGIVVVSAMILFGYLAVKALVAIGYLMFLLVCGAVAAFRSVLR